MGYTPVFDSIYTGTLYGRWPAAPVWASLLPLLDRHGRLDMSIEAICGMTGWPRELLLEGIRQLMEPDAHSRTAGHEGMRLVPLVEGRPWGWQAVNHALYREKARKANFDAARAEDGRNAARMAERRESREDPLGPANSDATREDPPSDSDSDSDSNKNKSKSARRRASRVPADFSPDLSLASEVPGIDIAVEAQKFRDWEFRTPRSDWPAAWRNWIRRCKETGQYAKKSNGGWV